MYVLHVCILQDHSVQGGYELGHIALFYLFVCKLSVIQIMYYKIKLYKDH